MEYKLKPINVDASSAEEVVIPDARDREVEKRGVVTFISIADLEENIKINAKTRQEVAAKKELEHAKRINIEHFHPFVLDMSMEDIITVHMYKESRAWLEACDKQLAALDAQETSDREEIAEIKRQIPELADAPLIESPYVEQK